MSATNPVTLSSSEDEQPSKRLKRNANDTAASSAVDNNKQKKSPPPYTQDDLPFEVYVVNSTQHHFDQTSIQGVYVTLEDATNAAWQEICYTDGLDIQSTAGGGDICVTLETVDASEGDMTVEVERVKLWAPGSIPPFTRKAEFLREGGGEDEEDDGY